MSSPIVYRPAAAAEASTVHDNEADTVLSDAMQVDTKAELDVTTGVSRSQARAASAECSDSLQQKDQHIANGVEEPSWSFADFGPAPRRSSVQVSHGTTTNNEALEVDSMEDVVASASHSPLPPIVNDADSVETHHQQLAINTTEVDSSDEDPGEENGDQNDQSGDQQGQAAQVPNTDHFVRVDRGDAVDESSDCKLCMTTPGPEDDPLYVECGHVWCKSCLNQYFAQSFTDRDQFPPRCCRPEGFNLEVFGMHLEDEVLINVMDKWEEWTAKDPTYCSNMQCNIFVPEYTVHGHWAVCLSCKVKTCVECKEGEARHLTPDQHPEPEKDEENAKLAETEGWKYCPNKKYNKIVEKIEGCDTMTCKCGQQFCYRCGNSFEGPYPCTCNGQNAWVGQVQAWANGADGDQANADGDDNAENEDDSESESDEEEEESGSDDSDEDEAEEDEEDDAEGEEDE